MLGEIEKRSPSATCPTLLQTKDELLTKKPKTEAPQISNQPSKSKVSFPLKGPHRLFGLLARRGEKAKAPLFSSSKLPKASHETQSTQNKSKMARKQISKHTGNEKSRTQEQSKVKCGRPPHDKTSRRPSSPDIDLILDMMAFPFLNI
uniref:Uncharacterized protein n=1 Tax=Cannabis sativa TaxID=3483 RepID=A0A803P8M5_CANSA